MWNFIKNEWPRLVLIFIGIAIIIMCVALLINAGQHSIISHNAIGPIENYELLITWQEDGVQREAHIRLVPISKEAK